jgi:hypothetical protein
LGITSLAVAGVWIYLVWWPGDRFATHNLMLTGLTMPVTGGALGLDNLLGTVPKELADPAPPEGTEAMVQPGEEGPLPEQVGPEPDEIEAGQQILRRLYIDMWVWLAISTVAVAWLALAGGSAAAGFPVADPAKRRQAVLAAGIAVVVALGVARQLWRGQAVMGLPDWMTEVVFVGLGLVAAYLLAVTLPTRAAGMLAASMALALVVIGGLAWRDWYTETYALCNSYPAAAPRIAAVVLTATAALAGAAMARHSIGLHRIATVAIIAAAITTLATLKYAESTGGIHSCTLGATTYAGIMLAQVSYGLVLIGALALRLR